MEEEGAGTADDAVGQEGHFVNHFHLRFAQLGWIRDRLCMGPGCVPRRPNVGDFREQGDCMGRLASEEKCTTTSHSLLVLELSSTTLMIALPLLKHTLPASPPILVTNLISSQPCSSGRPSLHI